MRKRFIVELPPEEETYGNITQLSPDEEMLKEVKARRFIKNIGMIRNEINNAETPRKIQPKT